MGKGGQRGGGGARWHRGPPAGVSRHQGEPRKGKGTGDRAAPGLGGGGGSGEGQGGSGVRPPPPHLTGAPQNHHRPRAPGSARGPPGAALCRSEDRDSMVPPPPPPPYTRGGGTHFSPFRQVFASVWGLILCPPSPRKGGVELRGQGKGSSRSQGLQGAAAEVNLGTQMGGRAEFRGPQGDSCPHRWVTRVERWQWLPDVPMATSRAKVIPDVWILGSFGARDDGLGDI